MLDVAFKGTDLISFDYRLNIILSCVRCIIGIQNERHCCVPVSIKCHVSRATRYISPSPSVTGVFKVTVTLHRKHSKQAMNEF